MLRITRCAGNSVPVTEIAPDGRLLYYTSYRDGFCCAWAQRIAEDGRPDGAPFAVYHRHESSLGAVISGFFEMRVTQDRLFMLLTETKGSLWSLKPNR